MSRYSENCACLVKNTYSYQEAPSHVKSQWIVCMQAVFTYPRIISSAKKHSLSMVDLVFMPPEGLTSISSSQSLFAFMNEDEDFFDNAWSSLQSLLGSPSADDTS